MITRVMENSIVIACPPDEVFAYVTQPWLWHEWHPSSRSAQAKVDVLAVGDCFDEVIQLQPLSPLPLTVQRQTRYTVLLSESGVVWEVRGETTDGALTIHYDFKPQDGGTLFHRRLQYEVRGALQLIEPWLLKPRMRGLSAQALANLKAKLEVC
ncbi:MAG: SRPBCC family protein [Alcanivoracaceae bacterium]|nr:SRPBCC family protein [Alcanivoracaceae bacterium]